MPKRHVAPRKQRTRQHLIADLSVHHVEGFILAEGHTAQRFYQDYGYDLTMVTYDQEGYVEPGVLPIQLKAAESLSVVRADYGFEMDVRDYNLWVSDRTPVILVLYDASLKRAFWLHVQQYFLDNEERRPNKGAKTVRVRVPARQRVNRRAILAMRQLKKQGHLPAIGEGT